MINLDNILPDSTAEILKGRKIAAIGEIREFGGKKYRKTPNGWRPVPKKESATINISEKPNKDSRFEDVRDLASNMNRFLQTIDIQQFVDILGKTSKDDLDKDKYRCIRSGSGEYGYWSASISAYLQQDGDGDYLQFTSKPSPANLQKCSERLEKILKKAGYYAVPEFYVLDFNPYYQARGTFGVGISIKLDEHSWEKSVRR